MNKIALPDFLKKAQQIPVLDVRSEGEYAQGHIPGSINIPILSNEQRTEVGTLYKKEGHQQAVLKGLQLAGPAFESMAHSMLRLASRDELLIHCWRGGMRSEIMAWIANLAGIKGYILEGGYKAFRNHTLNILSKPIQGILISGATGSGKTEILHLLGSKGFPVIDLEEAAQHRGSSFGAIGKPYRTQEMFENLLASEISKWPENQPVILEDESRLIGKKCIPEVWFQSMQQMTCITLETTIDQRIQRIQNEYAVLDSDELELAIRRLEKRLGNQRMKDAIAALKEQKHAEWISIMLEYYDKSYDHLKKSRHSNNFSLTFNWQNPEDSYRALIQLIHQQNIHGKETPHSLQ